MHCASFEQFGAVGRVSTTQAPWSQNLPAPQVSSFVHGVVQRNAVLLAREGDFGFSPANGRPVLGHDVELINFLSDRPSELKTSRFAFNCPQGAQGHDPHGNPTCAIAVKQAFTAMLRGINRPVTLRHKYEGEAARR